MNQTIMPLRCSDPPLGLVGGKARSLSSMSMSGLPVPDGFVVCTDAYRKFVADNDLQGAIESTIADLSDLDQAASDIRQLFVAAGIPTAISAAISRAYSALDDGSSAVAVRSSATAEDLPEFSFAGQQDSYLNVRGADPVIAAVRDCWASLWTARAIDYRTRAGIDHTSVAMGVVVQTMVPAQISGILFTANPTSGNRDEIHINSSFGLGEAIVGGLVTPDSFVLERSNLQITQSDIGAKAQAVVMAGEAGTATEAVPDMTRAQSSLNEKQTQRLAKLSLEVEALFEGKPQDIEWAITGDDVWLLQSRPITNLPPAPLPDVWQGPPGAEKLIRRQVVENMPDPLSPLFEVLYLSHGLDASMDEFLAELGAPIRIEEFVDRPFFLTVNGYAYCRADYRFSWRMLSKIPGILIWYCRALPRLLRNLVPHWRDEALPSYLKTISQWHELNSATASDKQLLSGVRALAVADARYWFDVALVMGAAKITDAMLHQFLKSMARHRSLTSGMFLRGFPSKTRVAQENLETIAATIRCNESLRLCVIEATPDKLLETLADHPDSQSLLNAIHDHLQRYGHQIYTLDFVQPTQQEDPTPVLLSLASLVADPQYDTPTRQAQMAEVRAGLERETLEAFGPVRRRVFRLLLRWAQRFGPNREEALFHIGAAWPVLRGLALELGRRLESAGSLATAEDVFFLRPQELVEASAARDESRSRSDLKERAVERKSLRTARMALHPPGTIPPKTPWKIGPFNLSAWETQKRNQDDSNTLEGFAVSPGQVTGVASLILSPADFQDMQPDTILVCPTTTPAWTPLFSRASGLVTDIGGILAHGSIVAREYGIPAVMGTGNITQRITSGQKLIVDGDMGTVTIVEELQPGAPSEKPTVSA